MNFPSPNVPSEQIDPLSFFLLLLEMLAYQPYHCPIQPVIERCRERQEGFESDFSKLYGKGGFKPDARFRPNALVPVHTHLLVQVGWKQHWRGLDRARRQFDESSRALKSRTMLRYVTQIYPRFLSTLHESPGDETQLRPQIIHKLIEYIEAPHSHGRPNANVKMYNSPPIMQTV